MLNNAFKTVFKQRHLYFVNPGKDFTSGKGYDIFSDTVKALMVRKNQTIQDGLDDQFLLESYLNDKIMSKTAPAQLQNQHKIYPEGFKAAFDIFTGSLPVTENHFGIRRVAFDGCKVNINYNPSDLSTFFVSRKTGDARGYNQVMVNSMYDLDSEFYTDFLIQNGHDADERAAFREMAKRSTYPGKTCYIGDRGQEGYRVMIDLNHIEDYYLIRGKDSDNRTIKSTLKLPKHGEVDKDVPITFSRYQNKKARANVQGIFKYLPPDQWPEWIVEDKFTETIRVVRTKIPFEDKEILLYTNLPRELFSPLTLALWYGERWKEEGGFRKIKYDVGLAALNALNKDFILQEIAARFLMFNYCSAIVHGLEKEIPECVENERRINFRSAVNHLRTHLKWSGEKPILIEQFILRYSHPVAGGRKFARYMRPQRARPFQYR